MAYKTTKSLSEAAEIKEQLAEEHGEGEFWFELHSNSVWQIDEQTLKPIKKLDGSVFGINSLAEQDGPYVWVFVEEVILVRFGDDAEFQFHRNFF